MDATRAEGLKIGAYHSLIDWHHPQAYAGFGLPTVKGVTNEGRDNLVYVDYLHRQVEEIMSGYGPIDIVWWDFSKPDCQGESWRSKELMEMIHKHQPQIVSNNRLYKMVPHNDAGTAKHLEEWHPSLGDFSTPEQHIPDTGAEGVDWETCMTMNTTWGYNQFDHKWKSSRILIQNLVDIVSKGGNYLLNIGPKADGTIPEESIERMKVIGEWMNVNGEAIYGTKASPFKKPKWGRYTSKSDRVYAHVFQWPEDGQLLIESKGIQASRAYLLADQEQDLSFKQTPKGLIIHLPKNAPDDIASVIAIKYKKYDSLNWQR